MAQPNSSASNASFRQAEAPPASSSSSSWLLPENRKLRNLLSISLRNLHLAPASPNRKRGKTIDDDAVPHALRSPAKLVSMREQKTLGHSRSSTDLRAVMENAISEQEAAEVGADVNGSPIAGKQKPRPQSTATGSPRRPDFKRLRRRSTIEWANASPMKRQERLEHVTSERMADVFFSLHVADVQDPVYVSEMVQKTMNPTFRNVDWSACGPGVTRLAHMTLRVWARRAKTDEWKQLIELTVDLRGLQYLGKKLETLEKTLPPNAILFQLHDGIYTSFVDSLADYVPSLPAPLKRSATNLSQRVLPTSSFDALLRLSKLDDSIQDALATRDQIADELERLLESNRGALNERDEVAEAEDRLKTIDYAKRTVEKQLEKAQKQQEEKRASLAARRRLMQSDLARQKTDTQQMRQVRPEFPTSREEHEVKKKAIQNQRRRICEELQHCYPVEPVAGKPLAFSIRGLHLPNSENLDSEPPETVCAALGSVAHTLQLLSFYLDQILPYPVTPRGNTSSIYDPISVLKTNTPFTSHSSEHTLRTYPLFSKGVPRFRFEYAVFLLNQNIRVLLENAFNLKVLDVRQTLPNLKYLLYVATAGEGELPARKAGGIRGLMRAPTMSRVASSDSTSSAMSGLTLHENGKPRGAADRLREISGKGKTAMKV